jgi:hypothetical protein
MYNPAKDPRPICDIQVICARENQIYFIQKYRADVEDPVAIWNDLCSKYGFTSPGIAHLRIEGNPRAGLIKYTYRLPASVMNVKIPAHQSRTFKIFNDDGEAWDSGEILSPVGTSKEDIWKQLSDIHPVPHFSQFIITYEHGEVPVTSRLLPVGHIQAIRAKFPVTWRLELFQEDVIQPDMHAGIDVDEAWTLLHNQVPRLYPNATYNYRGNLQPKAIITVQVFRVDVTFTIAFEVKNHGWITFPDNNVSNMTTRQEIYDHFSPEDPRIPPFAEYIEEESRPYHDGDLVRFNLKGFIEITDRSNESPGRNGGDNGRKFILPPIIYGKPPLDTSDPNFPKIYGGSKAPIDSDESESDSFPTDSEEDTFETGYAHCLARINHAIHNDEPIMVVFVGAFQGYRDQVSQCEFRVDFTDKVEQHSMPEFFEVNWQKVCGFSQSMGGDSVPGALTWTRNKLTDQVSVTDAKRFGRGLKVRFQHKDTLDVPAGIPMSEFEATFVIDLPYGLSIAFPAAQNLTDATLMQYMCNLTASWDGTTWSKPWNIF